MLPGDCFEIRVLNHTLHADRHEITRKIRKGTIVPGDQILEHDGTWSAIGSSAEFGEVFLEMEREAANSRLAEFRDVYTNFQVKPATFDSSGNSAALAKHCAIHPDLEPVYICSVCESLFCADCPPVTDGKRICLFCGGHCVLYFGQHWSFENRFDDHRSAIETEAKSIEPMPAVKEHLEWSDFTTAFIYPLRFKAGLATCALIGVTLFFGLIITLFRGDWMLLISGIITLGLVSLQFGVMARTFDNFERMDEERGYMPHISDFSFADDVIHPVFSGLTAYLEAFGPSIAVLAIAIAVAWSSVETDLTRMDGKADDAGAQVSRIIDQRIPDAESARRLAVERRVRQLESVFGRNHLVENEGFERLTGSLVRMTVWFEIPLVVLFVFGLVFFPGVCISVSRTNRSFTDRIAGGFREMKNIGFDYVKIMISLIVLQLISAVAATSAAKLITAIGYPSAALVVELVISGVFAAYSWVTASAILGIVRVKIAVE